MNTEKTYKILGFTEEITDCSCCGRSGLKGTLVLESIEGGDINYFGIVCGAKIAGNTKKVMQEKLTDTEKANINAARAEYRALTEKAEYDQIFIDREPFMEAEESIRKDWIYRTMALSRKLEAKSEEIAKKYFIKYSFKFK